MSLRKVESNSTEVNGALLEKVLIGNDLSSLSSLEKVQHIRNVCQTLGLNPLTKPIQLLKFQGKEVPYVTKDATEQLRKLHRVSIKVDTKILEGGIYVATATARTPDGREDTSTGVLSISGLKGDALANACMKAETKAKRRVTLSICGLGFMDESEIETIPNAKKLDICGEIPNSIMDDNEDCLLDFSSYMIQIENSKDEEELKKVFYVVKSRNWSEQPAYLKKLVAAKDAKKLSFKAEIEAVDPEFFGEIKSE